MSQKTWGGRFRVPTAKLVEDYTESISFDKRLYRFDVLGSQAHARMLAHVGLLTHEEAETICTHLDEIRAEIEAGKMTYHHSLEDIHTHIESALIGRIGDLGRKLHTARSRNDQVVTDLKLWMLDATDTLVEEVQQLQRAWLELAEKDRTVILPGYTHLQRAQPVLAAHYCLAHVEKLQRDCERLLDCRKRVAILPLGVAALAGTSLPIDRHFVAEQLGFASVTRNSLDTSSDRDFAAEFVFALSMIAIHLSAWCEEWILWTTTEFEAIALPDDFCTGSSIMPHKKNPDVLELTRGKTGRVLGNLTHLLMLLKGLPTAYNRDLQEDKPAIFDAFDNVLAALRVAAPLVQAAQFRKDRIIARLEYGFLDATTLMEFFIKKGVPMRTAHEAVGQLVRHCEENSLRLNQLPLEQFQQFCPGVSEEVYQVLGVENALNAFCSYGSTAPHEVQKQLTFWQEQLSAAAELKAPQAGNATK
ncbi:MAG: argininosuccinate lyase [Zavarzinella sp.]